MILIQAIQNPPSSTPWWVIQAVFAVGAAGAVGMGAMWRHIVGFNKRFDESNKRLEGLTREAIEAMVSISASTDSLAEMIKNSNEKLAASIQTNNQSLITLIQEFRGEMRREKK
jgi:hypothetical protein